MSASAKQGGQRLIRSTVFNFLHHFALQSDDTHCITAWHKNGWNIRCFV